MVESLQGIAALKGSRCNGRPSNGGLGAFFPACPEHFRGLHSHSDRAYHGISEYACLKWSLNSTLLPMGVASLSHTQDHLDKLESREARVASLGSRE